MQQKVICVCKICGKEFEGYKLSRYCAAGCKKIADRENMRRHYAREKQKREEAKARAAAIAMASLGTAEKSKTEPKLEPKKELFVPNTEQCKKGSKCLYWRYMSGMDCMACHYMLDTKKMCEKDADGKCLCYIPNPKTKTKTKKKKKSWEMPAPSASTLSGYKT